MPAGTCLPLHRACAPQASLDGPQLCCNMHGKHDMHGLGMHRLRQALPPWLPPGQRICPAPPPPLPLCDLSLGSPCNMTPSSLHPAPCRRLQPAAAGPRRCDKADQRRHTVRRGGRQRCAARLAGRAVARRRKPGMPLGVPYAPAASSAWAIVRAQPQSTGLRSDLAPCLSAPFSAAPPAPGCMQTRRTSTPSPSTLPPTLWTTL